MHSKFNEWTNYYFKIKRTEKITETKPVKRTWRFPSCPIGRFSEAGLHEWMPFAIFCTRSRKRLQLSLPGWFPSRCCFMLCITMEVEPRIQSSTNATAVAVAKITQERGWRVEKSVFASFFWLTRRLWVRGKKMRFGASYSTSNNLLLVARHILTTGLQKFC